MKSNCIGSVITAWCIQTIFVCAGAPWQLLERISAHSRAVEQTWGFQRVPELGLFCEHHLSYLLVHVLKEKVSKDKWKLSKSKNPPPPNTTHFFRMLRRSISPDQPAETRHFKSSVSHGFPRLLQHLLCCGDVWYFKQIWYPWWIVL